MCKSWNLWASHQIAAHKMGGGGQACRVQEVNCIWTGLCSFCAHWNPTAAPGKPPLTLRDACTLSKPAGVHLPPITISSAAITAIACFPLLPQNVCAGVSSTAWKSIIPVQGLSGSSSIRNPSHQCAPPWEQTHCRCVSWLLSHPRARAHLASSQLQIWGVLWLFIALQRNQLT